MKIFNPIIWLVICLTLGLAPFLPEPHVIEKLRWVFNDMNQMAMIDWFDLMMHGTPWIMLLASIIIKLKNN